MNPSTRDYYRELALCALHRTGQACTTDQLVEHMGVTAQAECHPRALWGGINAGSVAGFLRALENAGKVSRLPEDAPDPRHGRSTPCWTFAGPRIPNYPPPDPPESDEVRPRRTASDSSQSPYAGHDRAQLLALLDHSDEIMGAVARFLGDVRDINRRHRQRFIELGITAQ